MNKFLTLLLLFIYITKGIAQQNADAEKLSGEDLVKYENQARQLVSFMEFAYNTLGSDKSAYQDKHTIIEHSYLKFFKDNKVQIEDDLVEKRDVVTNKDVQAYLKDIDFFFKTVSFKYTIEEISQEVNEAGEIFFKIKASRNIKGTTLEGKDINENRPRYIEVNLDKINRDLKIVSVYTTKSNEEEELITWWNNLNTAWRRFFSRDDKVLDTIPLKDIIYIHNDYIVRESLYSSYNDSVIIVDTITVNQSKILPEVRRILRTDQIAITDVAGIYDLKPLYAFSLLRHLDITKAKIPDLEPIRNLSKLETLIASKSLIDDLEPIRYIPSIRKLDISGTLVSDISPIEAFENLEVLNISESRVSEIAPLIKLVNLRELNLNALSVNSLNTLKNNEKLEVLEIAKIRMDSLDDISSLKNLKRVDLSGTGITDVTELSTLPLLEFIFLDNTNIASLSPFESLSKLKVIYCDKTQVNGTIAHRFMQKRPDVKVIYESQELLGWWANLPQEWKDIFSKLVYLTEPPTREQLHEVSFIKSIDLSGNRTIKSIEPLTELTALNSLNISNTKISDIKPVSGLFDLLNFNLAGTLVSDITALIPLTSLYEIDISHSLVTTLEPLVKLPELRILKMDSTKILETGLISNMKRLEMLYADGVESINAEVSKIQDSINNILIIYRTQYLIDWWKNLPENWKNVLALNETIEERPDRIQLHRISSIKELNISQQKEITSLNPVIVLTRLEKLNMSTLQLADIGPLGSIDRLVAIDMSDTPVSDLLQLSKHKYLTEINCANSQVSDLTPLGGLKSLLRLNISGTQVTKLDALANCVKLEELSCYNTRVNSLKPLEGLKNIRLLRVYNTKLNERKIDKFKDLHPNTEVVYY